MTQKERLQELKNQRDPLGAVISHIQTLKGEKGETGPMGPQGPKGDKGDSIRGPQGAPGKDGRDGKNGLDGTDGRPGKDGKNGRDGKDGTSVNHATVVTGVITQLTTDKSLKAEHIEGLQDLPKLIEFLKRGGFRGGGGTSTAAATVFYSDTVSGTIDGANVTFTVPHTITTPLALHLANSIYQPTVDFTASGTTIIMVVAPDASLSGQPFWLLHT